MKFSQKMPLHIFYITIGLEIGLLTKIAFWSLLKVQSETDLWVKTVRKKSVAKLV